jgi:hypothetical protein
MPQLRLPEPNWEMMGVKLAARMDRRAARQTEPWTRDTRLLL